MPGDVSSMAGRFLNEEVKSEEDALQGARDIIAEWVNEDVGARNAVRHLFERSATVRAKVARGKEAEGAKFRDYFDLSSAQEILIMFLTGISTAWVLRIFRFSDLKMILTRSHDHQE